MLSIVGRVKDIIKKHLRKLRSLIIQVFQKVWGRGLTVLIRLTDFLADGVLHGAAFLGRYTTRIRLARGKPRSLWGVTPIITLPIKAHCDRLLGIESESLVFTSYHVTSKFDINLSRYVDVIVRRAPLFLAVFSKFVLSWALLRYDVFHYFYDRGILVPDYPTEPDQKLMIGIKEIELRLLETAEKRLYCFTYGSDVRTRSVTQALGKYNCCMDCPEPGRYCVCSEVGSRRNLEQIRPYARAMLATTDNVNDVVGGKIFHYWALNLERIPYLDPIRTNYPLVVAHAPNHPHFKGTKYLEIAVSQLKAEGVNIELQMVSGVSNEKVLEIFSAADLIVDQLITGGYGYTLLEAMACGKPVLCYLRDSSWIAAPEECPVVQTDPDHLKDTLRWCVDHRDELIDIGRHSRHYVEKYYSISAVAARLGNLYVDTANFPPNVETRLRRTVGNITRTLDDIK